MLTQDQNSCLTKKASFNSTTGHVSSLSSSSASGSSVCNNAQTGDERCFALLGKKVVEWTSDAEANDPQLTSSAELLELAFRVSLEASCCSSSESCG